MTFSPKFEKLLAKLEQDDPLYATQIVEGLLQLAIEAGASDLHLQPTDDGLHLKCRIDGVILPIGSIAKHMAGNIVVRIKVLAKLLTYETQLPQEGRIGQSEHPLDIRISTFPTIFGEKVVARFLQTGDMSRALLSDLGLPLVVEEAVGNTLSHTSGVLLIVGPAGSGKTTTAYSCLREIVSHDKWQRNIVSMEDPVEAIVEGIAQSEVSESVGFDLTSGLRSLVRQDPDVIFVGEIRDPSTANIAFQAALTGQLVITTFHASDTATAISRLTDMGIPPYVLRSAIQAVVAQQLVRRLCSCATRPKSDASEAESQLGLDVDSWHLPRGCSKCQQTGYHGRQVVAEVLSFGASEITSAIHEGVDAKTLQSVARQQGMRTLYDHGLDLVKQEKTSPAEIVRVLGLSSDLLG